MTWGLDAETERTFRQPIRHKMGNRRAITTLWQDIFTPQAWRKPARDAKPTGDWRLGRLAAQVPIWIATPGAISFCSATPAGGTSTGKMPACTWCSKVFRGCIRLRRNICLLRLAAAVAAADRDADAAGWMPRNTIARRMQIAEDTVGDHLKAIYAHFRVSSASELAALFWRVQCHQSPDSGIERQVSQIHTGCHSHYTVISRGRLLCFRRAFRNACP